jgi:hypothetical protein
MKKPFGLAFTLCFTLFTLNALAGTDRTYNIQLVVFSHLTPQTLALEQWPLLQSPSTSGASTASHPANALQSEVASLQKQPGYQVLFSGSWTETWHGDSGTITLPISNGNNLQGTVSVTLGHYFDVHSDLLLTEPTNFLQQMDKSGYFNRFSQSNFTFQVVQDRRMKSRELNYLGHPLMGVLIKILKD